MFDDDVRMLRVAALAFFVVGVLAGVGIERLLILLVHHVRWL